MNNIPPSSGNSASSFSAASATHARSDSPPTEQPEAKKGRTGTAPPESSLFANTGRGGFSRLISGGLQAMSGHPQANATTPIELMSDRQLLELNHIGKAVYKENILYHGTTEESKSNIQGGGFNVGHKVAGGTAARPDYNPNDAFEISASEHNYSTENKKIAEMFGNAAAGGDVSKKPALVRFMTDKKALEKDPDFEPFAQNKAYRTKASIPSENILRSKKSHNANLPTNAIAIFQDGVNNMHLSLASTGVKLENNHLSLSSSDAALLLKCVQSDSEEDNFEVEDSEEESPPASPSNSHV
ncbi:hypothetical protein [Collimonas humicola]|uniref:hypothetical protein n=1 Tax=Collimonas humicola TaxID=2825886 RepID=UPI001B8B58B7|nr:hypothetical protein [Collimonas humicola]